MASSDANADATAEIDGEEDSEEDPEFLGAGPEEALEKNSSAEEAFSTD